MDEIQKLILDKLDKLEEKLDHIATAKIPDILVDVAKINAQTSSQAKLYTIFGGAIAVLTSIGVSVAAMMLK